MNRLLFPTQATNMSSDNTDVQLSVQKQLETLFSQHNLKTDTQLLAQVFARSHHFFSLDCSLSFAPFQIWFVTTISILPFCLVFRLPFAS